MPRSYIEAMDGPTVLYIYCIIYIICIYYGVCATDETFA